MLFVAYYTKLSKNKQTNNKAKKNEEIEHDEIPHHLKLRLWLVDAKT